MRICRPLFFTVLTVSSLIVAAGCGNESDDTRPRQPVAGRVTLDGKPLSMGVIVFDPISKNEGTSSQGKVVDGFFSIARPEGPIPGSYFVRIDAVDPATLASRAATKPGEVKKFNLSTPKNLIPAHYNTETELEVTVKGNEANEFVFDLSTKGGKPSASRSVKHGKQDHR